MFKHVHTSKGIRVCVFVSELFVSASVLSLFVCVFTLGCACV